MGNVSSHGALLPISMASTIIGFVSFTFTVATFLRVFWTNLNTLFNANAEARSVLSTLRVELDEERVSLKSLRRHAKAYGLNKSTDIFSGPELDERDLHNLVGSVRRLIKRFDKLEQPFLSSSQTVQDRRRRRAERRGLRRSDYEKDVYYSEDEHVEDLYDTKTLARRWAWLRYRGQAREMLKSVNRLQTRRIARQVGEIACVVRLHVASLDETRDAAMAIEDKLNRVVGVRRVD